MASSCSGRPQTHAHRAGADRSHRHAKRPNPLHRQPKAAYRGFEPAVLTRPDEQDLLGGESAQRRGEPGLTVG
jgi:hypothetical protein